MTTDDKKGLKDHWVVVSIAALAGICAIMVACITIFSFLTGKDDLPELISTATQSTQVDTSVTKTAQPTKEEEDPTDTQIPTKDPTTGSVCSSSKKDDFMGVEIDQSIWTLNENSAPLVSDGKLYLSAASQNGHVENAIHLKTGNDGIKCIEVKIDSVDGTERSDITLQGHLKQEGGINSYFHFGLHSSGEIIVQHAQDGASPQETFDFKDYIPPLDSGSYILSVKWSVTDVQFFVNNDINPVWSHPSESPGWWFLLAAQANNGDSITGVFDWVKWDLNN